MTFLEWVGGYLESRQKMSKILGRPLPTEQTEIEYEFQVLPAMADKVAEYKREATQYYRGAKLKAEEELEAQKYPRSSLATLAKDRCGQELAVMNETEDLQSLVRERRWDIKKIKFGFQEKDS